MKILVDRHHADLLYSLQRLFEDRLGVDLYVPVGREWWDEDVWIFGKEFFGDDRLARQYLDLTDAYTPVDEGLYVTHDAAHPHRPIHALTLPAARALGLDFVMPTLDNNQEGFWNLAQQIGAQYLYQVGNQGQQILDAPGQKIIFSTTAPAPDDVPHVRIHQEFDSGPGQTYGFRKPSRTTAIYNFVNCFNELPGWPEFVQAEELLTPKGYEFASYGHGQRDGYVTGVEALADRMASAGWGWQDKAVEGEGFGHVIHAWAALGRPLIGRARHYRGRLAEPFWQDGQTCIDLDLHRLGEAVAMIEEISKDPARHLRMCEAIRAEFDEAVDYGAEAAAVADLLGLK